MKKKIVIIISVIILIALVVGSVYFVERQKERERIRQEVSARIEYVYLFALYNMDFSNVIELNIFWDDQYYYKKVSFEMEYTRDPDEYEAIFYPSEVTPRRVDAINNYLSRHNLEIEGFDGTDSPVTVEDIVYKYEKIQKIIDTMSDAAYDMLRNS